MAAVSIAEQHALYDASSPDSASYPVPIVEGPRSYEIPKRVLDLTLGTIGLVITGLLSIVLIPLIMLKSPGAPAIFAQTRVGQGGKTFTCYKFRTMQPDAEARKSELINFNETSGPVFKMKHDPRHIPDLRWLRKFSLDETPQFYNVVEGTMSMVGPRPPVPDEVNFYSDRQLERLAVKPGLTCTWQVNGRSKLGFEEWIAMDIDYINSRTTLGDIQLIIKTVPAVVSARGAA